MEVKILCDCGAKFAFDVEPVNGRMPVAIQCPQCSTDVTAKADTMIAQKLAASASASQGPVAVPPVGRLKVAGASHAVPVATPIGGTATAEPAAEMCRKHPRNAAAANCFVCQKPICSECMSMFGYLCSIQCKYQAEQQGIRVPKYEFQKTAVQNRFWQKAGRIGAGIAFTIVVLVSAAIWYEFSGSHPKIHYSVKYSPDTPPLHAELLGQDELLMVFPQRITVHDLDKKKERWSTPLREQSPASEEGSEDEGADSLGGLFEYANIRAHVTKDAIWVVSDQKIMAFDRQTGTAKHTLALPGDMTRLRVDASGMHVFTGNRDGKSAITTVDLATGAAKTVDMVPTPHEQRLITAELPEGVPPTAAFLLEQELASEEERKKALNTVYSRFIAAGPNTVEMQVRMVQPNIVFKEAMKKKGPSALNSNVSAASPVGTIAEEIFNDIKRDKTGGLKEVDESKYAVTVRRLINDQVQPFTVDVIGAPAFIPLNTVDVLAAGTMVYVLDKQNKKLFEAKLAYPVPEQLAMFAGGSPFLETKDSLYLFDQGVLTAFDLPGGNVRWRMTSVGISKIQADEDGDLYVNSTTGSPEDIQYSEQIKLDDAPKPILLKVEAKTGKVIWRSPNLGVCELSGKYVFALNNHSGGFGLAGGLSEALGSSAGMGMEGSHFRIFRIGDDNGRRVWEYYNSYAPEQVDFEGRRIMLRFGNEVRVLKFLAF